MVRKNEAAVESVLFFYGNRSHSAKVHAARQKLTEQKGYLRCIYVRANAVEARSLALYLHTCTLYFYLYGNGKYLRETCLSFSIYGPHLCVLVQTRREERRVYTSSVKTGLFTIVN